MNGYTLSNQYFVLKLKNFGDKSNNTHQRYTTVCAVICILNLNIIINMFEVVQKTMMTRSYLKTPACFDRT